MIDSVGEKKSLMGMGGQEAAGEQANFEHRRRQAALRDGSRGYRWPGTFFSNLPPPPSNFGVALVSKCLNNQPLTRHCFESASVPNHLR